MTTETIPWYTTVCPVTATATPVGPGSVVFPQNTEVGQPSLVGPVVEAAYPTASSSLQTLVKPATSVGVPQGSPAGSSVAPGSSSKPTAPAGPPSYPTGGSGNASPSGSWSGVPVGPSSVPGIPEANAASVMSASLFGLVIVMAAQVFVL